MPRIENSKILRKELPTIILIEKTDDANTMLRIFDFLKRIEKELEIAQENLPDYEIKIGAYTFSNVSCHNHPNELTVLSEFKSFELFKNDVVDLTGVLGQLEKDLSRKNLLSSEMGYALPCIIFLLDGSKKYITKNILEQMNNNKWFRNARRMAFLLNAHKFYENDDLLKVIGYEEAIVNVNNAEEAIEIFKSLFVCASITGEIIASCSYPEQDPMIFVDPINEDEEWATDDDW